MSADILLTYKVDLIAKDGLSALIMSSIPIILSPAPVVPIMPVASVVSISSVMIMIRPITSAKR